MIQYGHLNPSKETGTGCPIISKYGRTPENKHGGVGRQQQQHLKHIGSVGLLTVSDISDCIIY